MRFNLNKEGEDKMFGFFKKNKKDKEVVENTIKPLGTVLEKEEDKGE